MSKESKKKQEADIESDIKVSDKTNKNAEWYIVKGASGKENTIAQLIKQRVSATGLDNTVLEVVVPTQEKIVMKKGKKEVKRERLYPGYILINMEPTEEAVHVIRNTDGIQGFIEYNKRTRKPTAIKPEEAKRIIDRTKVKQAPVYYSDFEVNDTVKVTEGNWKEFIGTVQEVNEAKDQITVLLSIFDRETPVILSLSEVIKL